jgi:hypothetical protein
MSYYIVTAACGHVGNNHYIPIAFAIKADNVHEATAVARCLPRVKHQKKDAILSAKEVSQSEYETQSALNKADPYLACRTKQDSELIFDQIRTRVCVLPHFSPKEKYNHDEKAYYCQRKEREILQSLRAYAYEEC